MRRMHAGSVVLSWLCMILESDQRYSGEYVLNLLVGEAKLKKFAWYL